MENLEINPQTKKGRASEFQVLVTLFELLHPAVSEIRTISRLYNYISQWTPLTAFKFLSWNRKEPNLHSLYEEELNLGTRSPWTEIQSRWKCCLYLILRSSLPPHPTPTFMQNHKVQKAMHWEIKITGFLQGTHLVWHGVRIVVQVFSLPVHCTVN